MIFRFWIGCVNSRAREVRNGSSLVSGFFDIVDRVGLAGSARGGRLLSVRVGAFILPQ